LIKNVSKKKYFLIKNKFIYYIMSYTRKKNRRKYSRKKTKSCGCGVKLSKLFNLFKVTKKRKPKKQKGGG
tara:strand:+ start:325 stop:534 length:210 start_codon:yes stop_codon:yes gene_type:complete